ncbi:MAG: rod shape-determining protein MreC [Syntrophomonadaceae bacterium]|nr:rod shape-determining protein MreC [Syntrophomonadaceae bacterium]
MFKFVGKKGFWALLAVLVIFLILMHYSTGIRTEITMAEKLLQESITPLQNGLSGLKRGMSSVSTGLENKKELARQLAQMKKLNDKLSLENQQLREYKAETERLRILLDYKQAHQDQYQLVVARVIGRHPNNWFEFITIDKGTQDGISPGMAVISADGLVGRVSSVSFNSSQVTLITDHEMAVGAIVQNSRETKGIIEGMGESNKLRMINIPYYSNISRYERIVCSGLSQFYPKGIQIGYVQTVEKEANGLLLTATIRPAVAFDKLEEVMVITQIYPPVASEEQKE